MVFATESRHDTRQRAINLYGSALPVLFITDNLVTQECFPNHLCRLFNSLYFCFLLLAISGRPAWLNNLPAVDTTLSWHVDTCVPRETTCPAVFHGTNSASLMQSQRMRSYLLSSLQSDLSPSFLPFSLASCWCWPATGRHGLRAKLILTRTLREVD